MNIRIARFLDKCIGTLLCSFLSIFNKKGKNNKKGGKRFKSILIVQLWGVGETLLTLPAIRAIRMKFTNSRISVLTTERVKDIFLLDGDVDDVILLRLNPVSMTKFVLENRKRFDLVIDFEEYLNISAIISFFVGKYRIGFSQGKRSLLYDGKVRYDDRQHVVRTFLDLVRLLGIKYDVVKLIKIDIPIKDREFVNNLLRGYSVTKNNFIVGIAPGAAESAKSRMWPKERFAKLSDILIEKYKAKIIFMGNKDETELIKKIVELMENKKGVINFAGKVNLRQLFYLIERCNLVVSNDTGPMHVAAAQRVKAIGLFGPNLPVRWKPYGKGNVALYKKQECSPCINVHLGQVPECKWKGRDYQKCMKAITVEDVLRAVEKVL